MKICVHSFPIASPSSYRIAMVHGSSGNDLYLKWAHNILGFTSEQDPVSILCKTIEF